jgi:hypothetical protein
MGVCGMLGEVECSFIQRDITKHNLVEARKTKFNEGMNQLG